MILFCACEQKAAGFLELKYPLFPRVLCLLDMQGISMHFESKNMRQVVKLKLRRLEKKVVKKPTFRGNLRSFEEAWPSQMFSIF